MRRKFAVSWPQCVLLLVIAGTLVAVPEVNLARLLLAGLVVAVAAIGAYINLTGKEPHRAEQKDNSPDEN